ncbi:MAG: hypothetical protein HC902_06680 [Calothrix sp. SM1_5_4]|nr:hypothetical protein [Calothrix sp. SM1_5_4]
MSSRVKIRARLWLLYFLASIAVIGAGTMAFLYYPFISSRGGVTPGMSEI